MSQRQHDTQPTPEHDAPREERRTDQTTDRDADQAVDPNLVPRSEGAIYAMQARHGRMAATEALADAKRHLTAAADVKKLVRQYPWASVGGAAAVGLVAAMALTPSPKQQAAARLRALERALRTEAAVGSRALTKQRGMGGKLFRMGLRLARPALISLLTGAAGGAATGAAAGSQVAADTDAEAEAARQAGEEAARQVARESSPSPEPGIGDVT